MKNLKQYIWNSLVIGAIALTTAWIGGCSSEVNPDFVSPNKHPFADGEHVAFLQSENWNTSQCFSCHIHPETPQIAKPAGSCSSTDCHGGGGTYAHDFGPLACNTCHGNADGDANVRANWAPPSGIKGRDDKVGAHQAHLSPSGDYRPVNCQECHIVPNSVEVASHIDTNTPEQAEVRFSGTATARGSSPEYSYENMGCSSTYCHGSGSQMNWLSSVPVSCGDCHKIPPETRIHTNVTTSQCINCHSAVVDENMKIINPLLHINGRVDHNN